MGSDNVKDNKQRRSSTAGFTLIELLVVIAIIGILVSFAVPSYKEFQLRQDREISKVNLIRWETNFLQRKALGQTVRGHTAQGGYGDHKERGFGSSDIYTWFNADAVTHGVSRWGIFMDRPYDKECARFDIHQTNGRLAKDSDGNDNTEFCWNN